MKPRTTLNSRQDAEAATRRRQTEAQIEAEKARAADDAKTARLRALRLAKEAADKREAETVAAEKHAATAARNPAPRRRSAAKT
jgi:hypothetical protein